MNAALFFYIGFPDENRADDAVHLTGKIAACRVSVQSVGDDKCRRIAFGKMNI